MAGINMGDTLEITVEGALLGQRTMNIFHYNVIAPSTAPSFIVAMNALLADWLNSATGPQLMILAAAAQNWECQNIRGQRLWPTRSLAVYQVDGRPGLRPADCTAPNLSAVITKHGEFGTRKDVGSFHLAGLSDLDYTEGLISGPQLTRMDALATRIRTTLVVAGGGTEALPCLIGEDGPAATRTIVQCEVQDTLRVMRRRTLRVGI